MTGNVRVRWICRFRNHRRGDVTEVPLDDALRFALADLCEILDDAYIYGEW